MNYPGVFRLFLFTCGFCLAFSFFTSGAFATSDRIALVIGNGAYKNAPELPNPPNDARAIAKALTDIGFETDFGQDIDRAGMERHIRDFLRRATTAKVVLLFYAGHGMQAGDRNYLLPVDAKLETTSDLSYEAIELDKVVDNLNDPSRTNIIILDACRDNPLARSFAARTGVTRSGGTVTGFAPYTSLGTGTLIAYATAPGKVALDGQGANSPFTQGLLRHLKTPGLEVRQMLTRVRVDVLAATREKQIPWDNSSLVGDVYLAGMPASGATAVSQETVPIQPPVTQPPQAKQYGYIVGLEATGDNFLALRSEPSSERGQRLMKMGPETVFEIISRFGDWHQIRLLSGKTGWAYSKYVGCCKQAGDMQAFSSTAPEPLRFSYIVGLSPTGDNWLALRSQPTNLGDNMIKRMSEDTLLTVIGREGDWVHVRLQTGETGWAFSRFIACCK